MALETLKDTKEIGGFPINHMEDFVPKEVWEKVKTYININHADNTISFKIQDGPIKEAGVNGCQVDTIIHAAKKILEGLDAKCPSEYNKHAINKLDMALTYLAERTRDREARGVEGTEISAETFLGQIERCVHCGMALAHAPNCIKLRNNPRHREARGVEGTSNE